MCPVSNVEFNPGIKLHNAVRRGCEAMVAARLLKQDVQLNVGQQKTTLRVSSSRSLSMIDRISTPTRLLIEKAILVTYAFHIQ